MDKSEAGKGDGNRTVDKGAFDTGYERIYGVDIRIPPPDKDDYAKLVYDIANLIGGVQPLTDAELIIEMLVKNWRKG
jgi:hypothetical protein